MAVYTQVSTAEASRFLGDYALGDLQALTGIRQGVENSNFRLETTKGRYILTLYEKRVREAELPFFIGLMEHLAAHGLPCPLPIKGKDGQALRRLNDRPAAIISFLEGRAPERISPEICHEVGQGLARMHVAGAGMALRRDNALRLPAWVDLFAKCADKADTVKPGLAAQVEKELDFLLTRWPDALPEGVIHADLFPDNVFFNGDALCGLIDFYFACNDFLAYDLAITMNAWCFEREVAFNVTKAQAMMHGYEMIRPLSAAESRALPVLARGAALRFLLTRLYDWLNQVPDALVKAKNPLEYLSRLNFHQQVSSASAYGVGL